MFEKTKRGLMVSNGFDMLSTTQPNSVPIENVSVQPSTVRLDPTKKPATSSSPESRCSSPRAGPSFMPPGTPPSTSATFEQEIRAVIRELSLETNALAEIDGNNLGKKHSSKEPNKCFNVIKCLGYLYPNIAMICKLFATL